MDQILDFLLRFSSGQLYLLCAGYLLACGLGLPMPEDVALLWGGYVSYLGLTRLDGMIAVALAGVLFGDSFMFFLGSHFGRQLTQKWLFRKLLPEERLSAVREKFHQKGNRLIFAARFMPGLRSAVYFSAGTLHLPYRVFFFYDGAAAMISVPSIVSAAYWFGDEFDRVTQVVKKIEYGIVYILIALVVMVLVKWYLSHRKVT